MAVGWLKAHKIGVFTDIFFFRANLQRESIMLSRYKPTPKTECPTAACLSIPAGMTDEEVKKFLEDFKAAAFKHRQVQVSVLWARRYDPQLDTPVFYVP